MMKTPSPPQAVVAGVAVEQPAGRGQVDRHLLDGGGHAGVVHAQEAGDGHHEARGVEDVAAEGLGVGPDVVVPAVIEDGGADLLPMPGPEL